MKKAAGIISIIGGIFGIFAAIFTLMIGGIGSAFKANGYGTVVGLGFGGILFSFLSIILGAIVMNSEKKLIPTLLIINSILGIILGGTFVAFFMSLVLIAGILAYFDKSKKEEIKKLET